MRPPRLPGPPQLASGKLPEVHAPPEAREAEGPGADLARKCGGDAKQLAKLLANAPPAVRDEAMAAAHELYGNGFVGEVEAALDQRGKPKAKKASPDEAKAKSLAAKVKADAQAMRGKAAQADELLGGQLMGYVDAIVGATDELSGFAGSHAGDSVPWAAITAALMILVSVIAVVMAIACAVLSVGVGAAVSAGIIVAAAVLIAAAVVSLVATVLMNVGPLMEGAAVVAEQMGMKEESETLDDAGDWWTGNIADKEWFTAVVVAVAVCAAVVGTVASMANPVPLLEEGRERRDQARDAAEGVQLQAQAVVTTVGGELRAGEETAGNEIDAALEAERQRLEQLASTLLGKEGSIRGHLGACADALAGIRGAITSIGGASDSSSEVSDGAGVLSNLISMADVILGDQAPSVVAAAVMGHLAAVRWNVDAGDLANARDKASDGIHKAEEAAKDVTDQVGETFHEGSEALNDAADDGADEIRSWF